MVCFDNAEQPPGSPNPFFSPKLRNGLRLKGAPMILAENERGREKWEALFFFLVCAFA